jgi:hypothetical protein
VQLVTMAKDKVVDEIARLQVRARCCSSSISISAPHVRDGCRALRLRRRRPPSWTRPPPLWLSAGSCVRPTCCPSDQVLPPRPPALLRPARADRLRPCAFALVGPACAAHICPRPFGLIMIVGAACRCLRRRGGAQGTGLEHEAQHSAAAQAACTERRHTCCAHVRGRASQSEQGAPPWQRLSLGGASAAPRRPGGLSTTLGLRYLS